MEGDYPGLLGWFFEWTNRIIAARWPWLIGCVFSLVIVFSGIKYQQDRRLTEKHTVSTERLETDCTVSVLVPAWNECENIERLLETFRGISYPHRELVLCAGGDDGTYERARAVADRDDQIRVLRQTHIMNKQAALNACLDEATGEVLYLVDGDCILDDETWNAALRPVAEGKETVVAGTSRPLDCQWGQLLPTYQHVKEQYERAHRPRYVDGLLGRNAVVARTAMGDLRRFDESVQAGTDYNLAKRLLAEGHRIRFVPNSRIQSTYPETVTDYFAQQSRWIRNVIFLGRKWEATDETQTAVVTCFVGIAMILTPFFGVLWLPLFLGWLSLVVYGGLARIRWILFFRRVRTLRIPSRLIILGFGLMFIEFAAWTYTVAEILLPSRRRKW